MIGTNVVCDGIAGTVVEATLNRVRVEFDDGTWANFRVLTGPNAWDAIGGDAADEFEHDVATDTPHSETSTSSGHDPGGGGAVFERGKADDRHR